MSNKSLELEFCRTFEEFYKMIESEFWDAHDIIYKDYLKSKKLINNNPFVRIFMELSVLLYNITTFLLYVSFVVLYFSTWKYFKPMSVLPNGGY